MGFDTVITNGTVVTATDTYQADVAIEGRCTTLTALSDFVSGLETSNYFERPVEIVDSAVEPATAGTPDLIHFSVKAARRRGSPTITFGTLARRNSPC